MPNNTPTPQPPPRAAPVKFVPDTRPLTGRDRKGEPPTWAIIVMIGVIGFVGLMYGMPFIAYAIFPFAHSDFFWIGLIFLPMVALLAVAIASKLIELRQAKSWVPATGRILSSGVETRRHQFEGEPETVKNVPAVKYEFKVGGPHRGRHAHRHRRRRRSRHRGDAQALSGRRRSHGLLRSTRSDQMRARARLHAGPQGQPSEQARRAVGLPRRHRDARRARHRDLGLAVYGPDFVRAHFPRLHSHAEMPVARSASGWWC